MPSSDAPRAALARKLKRQQAQVLDAISRFRTDIKRRPTPARRAHAVADAQALKEARLAAKQLGQHARTITHPPRKKPTVTPADKGLLSGLVQQSAAVNPDIKQPAVRYMPMAGSLWNPATGIPGAEDVTQGFSGDCYFLSSLAAVALCEPATIATMIVATPEGYRVRFHRVLLGLVLPGPPIDIAITAELPVDAEGNLVYARTGEGGAQWVPLMEKAFIKFEGDLRTGLSNGSYSGVLVGIEAGSPSAALSSITGRNMPSTLASEVSNAGLARASAADRPVTLMSRLSIQGDGGYTDPSKLIFSSHAYYLERYDDATGKIHIRNPHGWHFGPIALDETELHKHFLLVQGNLN